MRVLHAVHDYLPDQVAGVEVYTNRVAQRLSLQHDVAILYATLDPTRPTGTLESSVEENVTLYALAQNRDWRRFEQSWNDPRVVDGILRALDLFEPDVVHVQHLMNLGVSWLDELERRGIPTVMTLHDQWWACAAGGQRFRPDRGRCDDLVARRCATCTSTLVGPALALRGRSQLLSVSEATLPTGDTRGARPHLATVAAPWIRSIWSGMVALGGASHIEGRWDAMRRLGDRIDLFVAPSIEIREAAIDFGFPADRVLHLPHGMPLVQVDSRPLPDCFRRFGYVGSLVPHKGVHHLVEAFAQLPEDARLDVYGSLSDAPDYVSELKDLIQHPGIRLHGQRAPAEIPELLAGLDALVAPSIWRENAPLNVQEAFVAGRPVIASDLGGHPELLASGGGLLFEPGNVESLAAALLRLAMEPGLGRRLASQVPTLRSLGEHTGDLVGIYRQAREGKRLSSRNGLGERGALFLDRDGVINRDSSDFIRSLEDWEPLPGSLEAIARLSRAGYRIFVVTNQSGLSRSLLSARDLAGIHEALVEQVSALGGRVEGIVHCPHAPDAGCECRKPRPGLIEKACREFSVEAIDAPFVGDRVTDLVAARAAGCRPIFVRSGSGTEADLGADWPEVPRFDDLAAATEWLLRPVPVGQAFGKPSGLESAGVE